MLQGLHAQTFFVTDVPAAIVWYENLLGFPPAISRSGFATFRGEGFDLCFHAQDEKSSGASGRQVGYFRVANLDEALRRWLGAGATLYRPPLKKTPEGERICQLRDPFGNTIGLIEITLP